VSDFLVPVITFLGGIILGSLITILVEANAELKKERIERGKR
jgi:uncharacterized membrane protein